MTSPKGHVPPSQRSHANKKIALANKHLIVKETLKCMYAGACDPTTNTSLDGEGIITISMMMSSLTGQWGLVLMGDGVSYFIIILQAKDEGIITNFLLPTQRGGKFTTAACLTQR